MGYATRQDVYDLGFGAQAFASRPRPVAPADVDPTTGTIRLRAHGMASTDLIVFEVPGAGALPSAAGLTAFQVYTPIIVSADLFRVSGFASFADRGAGWAVTVDPERRIDRLSDVCSAEIDEVLTAEEPPLRAPYPLQVVGLCARLVARYGVTTLALENQTFRVAMDRVEAKRLADEKTMDGWRSGKPINPRAKDQNSVPDNAAIADWSRPPTHWRTGSL